MLIGLYSAETSETNFSRLVKFASKVGVDINEYRRQVAEKMLGEFGKSQTPQDDEAIAVADIAEKAKTTKDIDQSIFLWGLYLDVVKGSKFGDMYQPKDARNDIEEKVYSMFGWSRRFLDETNEFLSGEGKYKDLKEQIEGSGIKSDEIVGLSKCRRSIEIVEALKRAVIKVDNELSSLNSREEKERGKVKSVQRISTDYLNFLDSKIEELNQLGVLQKLKSNRIDEFKTAVGVGLSLATRLYETCSKHPEIVFENSRGLDSDLLGKIRSYRQYTSSNNEDRSTLLRGAHNFAQARKKHDREASNVNGKMFPHPSDQRKPKGRNMMQTKQRGYVYSK